MRGSLRGAAHFLILPKEVLPMNAADYRAALLQAAQISKELSLRLDDDGQDLLESYANVYEQIIRYECANQK